MSVSKAMVESGVAMLARSRRLSDEALVAKVYSAMEAVAHRESVKAPAAAPPYVHQSWPAFRYGPNGQSAKFNSEDDVPAGWADSPKKVAPTFVEAAKAMGAETVADLVKRKPGRPRASV